jgi:hypothetical protein
VREWNGVKEKIFLMSSFSFSFPLSLASSVLSSTDEFLFELFTVELPHLCLNSLTAIRERIVSLLHSQHFLCYRPIEFDGSQSPTISILVPVVDSLGGSEIDCMKEFLVYLIDSELNTMKILTGEKTRKCKVTTSSSDTSRPEWFDLSSSSTRSCLLNGLLECFVHCLFSFGWLKTEENQFIKSQLDKPEKDQPVLSFQVTEQSFRDGSAGLITFHLSSCSLVPLFGASFEKEKNENKKKKLEKLVDQLIESKEEIYLLPHSHTAVLSEWLGYVKKQSKVKVELNLRDYWAYHYGIKLEEPEFAEVTAVKLHEEETNQSKQLSFPLQTILKRPIRMNLKVSQEAKDEAIKDLKEILSNFTIKTINQKVNKLFAIKGEILETKSNSDTPQTLSQVKFQKASELVNGLKLVKTDGKSTLGTLKKKRTQSSKTKIIKRKLPNEEEKSNKIMKLPVKLEDKSNIVKKETVKQSTKSTKEQTTRKTVQSKVEKKNKTASKPKKVI